MNVSFVTTCKGRRWQLERTLPANLDILKKDHELVLLDYHSGDNILPYIKANFGKYLANGQLTYYQLATPKRYFEMAYAKNVAHLLGQGRVLFSLDADNFIGDDIDHVDSIVDNVIYTPDIYPGCMGGIYGRIGLTKNTFLMLNGYNENFSNVEGEDGNMVTRASIKGCHIRKSPANAKCIDNTPLDKVKFRSPNATPVATDMFGYANVVDIKGRSFMVGEKLNGGWNYC